MPRASRPCWDAYSRRWRARICGKTFIIGGEHANYSEVARKHAELMLRYTGRPPEPDEPPLIVHTLAVEWLKSIGCWSTAPVKDWPRNFRWRRDNILKWVEYCDSINVRAVSALERMNLMRFADYCKAKGWSPWTVRHYVFTARAMLTWARENEHTNVTFLVPRLPKAGYTPQDLRPEDVAKLLNAMDASPSLQKAARVVRFVLLTGCRPGEARLLRWKHVRLHQQIAVLPFEEHKTGRKTGKSRTIYLSPEAIELLESIRPPYASEGDYIFKSRLGKPYSRDGLRTIMSRRGVYPYALRHTWAQSMVDSGVPLEVVSAALGHESILTTRRYAEVRSTRVIEALASVASPVQRAIAAQCRSDSAADEPDSGEDRSREDRRASRGRSAKGRAS